MAASEEIRQSILQNFANSVEDAGDISGVPTFYINAKKIVDVCAYLKQTDELKFDYLTSLSAVDWPDRFDVVYHLYSISHKHYVTLKVKLDKKNPVIQSVVSVWKAANWQEREVYDMFGIEFEGHPDLTRILLEPSWEGFPLRKDYVQK
ncbi:MAG: NADH-quinone oxidoreductase subunit C [Armatimonadota bacterium]